MEKRLFIDLMKALPSDAMIVGFHEDLSNDTVGIYVESDTFGATPMGGRIPEIQASFRREPDGSAVFIRLDYENGLSAPVTGNSCQHEWVSYAGLSQIDQYCKHCGKSKT